MMQAASGIIKQKKETYLILSPVNLLPVPKITAETFYAVYPNAQYKAYQAFESSDVSASYTNNNFVKSEERKNKTFYYQKTDQSGYDLIINNSTPVVPVQFVLKIQMEYKLIRS
jgi:hypothetical protein